MSIWDIAMLGDFTNAVTNFGRWYDIVWMEKCISTHPRRPSEVRDFCDIRDEYMKFLESQSLNGDFFLTIKS